MIKGTKNLPKKDETSNKEEIEQSTE